MRYNLSKIRTKTTYTPQEVGYLLNIDRKTVFRWLKEGLPLLDPIKTPKLVMGNDLKTFLQAKRIANQSKLNWNEFYCFHCRKAVLAKRGTEKKEKTGKDIGSENTEQEMILASCKDCSGSIARLF